MALSQIKPGQPAPGGSTLPQHLLIHQQQQFQLQPFQVKPPAAPSTSIGSNLKPKNKKRTTPTPPKH